MTSGILFQTKHADSRARIGYNALEEYISEYIELHLEYSVSRKVESLFASCTLPCRHDETPCIYIQLRIKSFATAAPAN